MDKSQIIQFEQNSQHEDEPYVDDEDATEDEPRVHTLYVDDEDSQFPAVSNSKHGIVTGPETSESRYATKNFKNDQSTEHCEHILDSIYDNHEVEEKNGMIPLTTVVDEEVSMNDEQNIEEIE